MDDVAADTIAIIAKRVAPEKRNLQPTDRLDDLGIDSFSAVEMIFDLEEKFDIQIPFNSNDVRPEFETVGDVVAAITKLIGGQRRWRIASSSRDGASSRRSARRRPYWSNLRAASAESRKPRSFRQTS